MKHTKCISFYYSFSIIAYIDEREKNEYNKLLHYKVMPRMFMLRINHN